MTIYKKLLNIQSKLKAPKSQYNSFGKYHYRSCEDILEGLKPILKEEGATLIIADNVVQVGDRYYIESTARLIDIDSGETIETKAMAREEENLKGQSSAQVSGSTSSYSRKYCLNAMFCIDDTKDSDFTNTHGKEEKQPQATATTKTITEKQEKFLLFQASQAGLTKEQVLSVIKKEYNLDAINVLNKTQFDAILARIEAKKAQ